MGDKAQKARAAYEADVAMRPYYHDGSPRKAWDELDQIARISWARSAPPPDDLQREPPADDTAGENSRLRARVESLEADKARLVAALEANDWRSPEETPDKEGPGIATRVLVKLERTEPSLDVPPSYAFGHRILNKGNPHCPQDGWYFDGQSEDYRVVAWRHIEPPDIARAVLDAMKGGGDGG